MLNITIDKVRHIEDMMPMYAKRLSNYSTHLINLNRKDIFMTLCALTTLRHTYAT